MIFHTTTMISGLLLPLTKIIKRFRNRYAFTYQNAKAFYQNHQLYPPHCSILFRSIDSTEATVHWLRHTGSPTTYKIRPPRKHVRDDTDHTPVRLQISTLILNAGTSSLNSTTAHFGRGLITTKMFVSELIAS